MKKTFSIKIAWYALIVLISAIPMIVLLVWFAYKTHSMMLESAFLRETLYYEGIKAKVNSEIARLFAILHNKSDPIAYTLEHDGDSDLLITLSKAILSRERNIHGIYIFDRNSRPILGVDRQYTTGQLNTFSYQELIEHEFDPGGVHEFDSESPSLVISLHGRNYIGNPKMHEGEMNFDIAVPIGSRDSPVGALVARVDVGDLWETLDLESSRPEAYSYIVDRRGSLLSVPPPGSRYMKRDILTQLHIVRSLIISEEHKDPEPYEGLIGIPVFGIGAQIGTLSWAVISEIPVRVIVEPIQRVVYGILFIGSLLIIIFGWLGLSISRRMLDPIAGLSLAFDRARTGDYSTSAPTSSIRELNVLAEGFNHMISDINMREKAVRESSHLLEESQKVANLGSYTLYVSSGMWSSSEIMDEIFGITDKAFTKDTEGWLQIVHPEQREEMQSYFVNHVLANRNKFDKEYRIIRLDDEKERWVHGMGELVLDENQNPVKMIGTIQDITERKKAEKEIEYQKTMFESIFNSVADAILLTDIQRKIVMCNPAFTKILGYSPQDVIGKETSVFYESLEVFKQMGEERYNLSAEEKLKPYVVNYKRKDGPVFPGETMGVIIRDRSGIIIGFLGTIRDITERKQLEQQLIQSEKLSSIGTFVAGVAHELNNPLTAILGYSDMLLDNSKNLSEETKHDLNVIKRQSERASRIVESLLKFARDEKHEKHAVQIDEVFESAIILQEYRFHADNIEIVRDYEKDMPSILANYNSLQQVFMNILLNAHQAMTKNNITGEIRVKAEYKNKEIVISIENDGLCIPEEELSKVFDPFFTTKEVGKGTGLGLSVSHGILKDHQGNMAVENIEMGGVRFIITLPVSDKKPVKRVEKEGDDYAVIQGMRVLIVDDEKSIRDFVKRFLTKKDIFALTATNGDEAIKMLEHGEFDAIISEVKMPVMGGLELGNWLHENKPDYLKRFVLATGFIEPEIEEYCEQNNCRYIQKPYKGNKLFEVLSKIMKSEGNK